MPKKEDYERVFNELLGTHIHWSRLAKEELVELATIFNNPTILLEKLGVKERYKRKLLRERLIEGVAEFMEEWEGPLMSLARKVFGKEEKERKEQKTL